MDVIKSQTRRSFRMEMIGTACYRGLAVQYWNSNRQLSEKFYEFSKQEEMHGRLFKEFYRKTFGKNIRAEKFWLFLGSLTAQALRPLPLKAKLKQLHAAEYQAVVQIESALKQGPDTGFHKIIRRILPDEKAHAALYNELFVS